MAESKPAPCQVRNKTVNPCPRRAEVEILGVAYCGACAREQEAYFVIGELTEGEARDFCGEALVEALERSRRERAGSTKRIEGEMHHGRRGMDEREPLAIGRGYPSRTVSAAPRKGVAAE